MYLTARQGNELLCLSFFFTLLVSTIFSGSHVSRPTVGTKLFDSASNSLLSDGPIGLYDQ